MRGSSRAVWVEAAIVVVVTIWILAATIGAGELRTYDEALYGMFARTALANDVWLYPVNAAGEYSTQFSKPPLSIWLVGGSFSLFGASMISLRLPFAAAYVITVLVAWAWGRRIGGPAMGLAWGLGLALCASTVRWGRVACIEPMFIGPCLVALAAHAESLRPSASRRWLVLAGVGLALAFFAKQLAFGIAALPIAIIELAKTRAWNARIRRLAIVFGIPAAIGGAWLVAADRALGPAFVKRYFEVGIVERLQGFAQGQNLRQLNEVARLLDEACAPIPWELGVVGLACLCVRELQRRAAPDSSTVTAWHLPLFAVTAALVYENATSSLLPWYTFGLVVPVVGGVAFLVAQLAVLAHAAIDDAHSDAARTGDALQWVAAILGAAALLLTTIAALEPVMSRVDAIAVLALAGVVAATTWSRTSPRARMAVLRVALALPLFALVAGRLRDDTLHQPPGRFETLMRALTDANVQDVALDTDARIDTDKLAITLFGVGMRETKRAPWETSTSADAYVTVEDVPLEAEIPDGARLVRAAGAVLWVGELAQPPWPRERQIDVLREHGLGFEAEDLATDRGSSLAYDDDTSGGAMRRISPWLNEAIGDVVLTRGPALTVPAGSWTATLRLRWDCRGYTRRPAHVEITVGERKQREELDCSDGVGASAWREVAVPFRVDKDAPVQIVLVYHHGRVWHDWTRIEPGA